jgi:DNA-binding phage protein
MALTRSFKESIQARLQADAAFREAMLAEAVDALLAGEVDVGKSLIRDFINGTIGFEPLATATGTPAKSLMRMFSPAGNPSARKLFAVLSALQRHCGISLSAQHAVESAA